MKALGGRKTQLLQKTGLFDEGQIADLLDWQRQHESTLAQAVTGLNLATEELFLQELARVTGLPFIHLAGEKISSEVLQGIPTKAVFEYQVIPVDREEDGVLRIATHSPFRPGMVDALRTAAGVRIRLALSPQQEIVQAIKSLYGVGAETLDRMIQDDRIELAPQEDLSRQDLSDLDQEASVVKFVNQIIWEAFQERATDIHIEPMEIDLRIRYRIDGVLHNAPVPPQIKRFQPAIISRIKVMANMDISEKRLPQDGRISMRVRGEEIDVRVSSMPTVYGESMSLRLLLRSGTLITMSRLGLDPVSEARLTRLIRRPHGILLVTGPTGSGKSTSLYAWLQTINSTDRRILTAEDPIEYEMVGINQVQMRPEIGLTFAHTLRTFLRQDPDVIMVGEIRDRETAEIAIRAALTGHLVFSTLHTNDSAGAITRLLDMGIEPFLAASSLEGIVAQRLVRRLCPECRRPWSGEPGMLEEENFPVERMQAEPVYEACGCETCHRTGFRGRTGLFETMLVTDNIRPLIVSRAAADEIKNTALHEGMKTLRDDGWEKVLQGLTTIEEVLRVTEED